MGDANDELFSEIIALMETAKAKMESLRTPSTPYGWNGRALSIAITELETALLWLANARRD